MVTLATVVTALCVFSSAIAVKLPAASFDLSKTYTDFDSIYKALLENEEKHPSKHKRQSDPDILPVDGYQQTFGPLTAANEAPGYMGFILGSVNEALTNLCATTCNGAGVDANGGLCKFFNVWIPEVNGVQSNQAVCALYYFVADQSTATNTGQGNLTITRSYGFSRINYLPDGTFEGFKCSFPTPSGSYSCSTTAFGGWVGTSPPRGTLDATIVNVANAGVAHFGYSYAQLGGGTDQFPGTLSVQNPIPAAIPPISGFGIPYVLSFFIRAQHAPQPGFPDITPTLNVTWNGQVVLSSTGYHPNWEFKSVGFYGNGNDTLSFTGGSFPEFIELDDIYLFLSGVY